MKTLSRGLLAAACATAALAPSASAAPQTVQLRIEGATRTLFEGPVTTDVAPFRFSDSPSEYECDGTPESNAGGTSATPAVTRGAVIAVAALRHGFSLRGTFSPGFGSPVFSEVAGENVGFDPVSGRYLVEYRNQRNSDVGACAETVGDGDEALFAYAGFGAPALRLTGPATVRPGEPFTVRVTTGGGAAVSGATVGGATTNDAGEAGVVVAERGPRTLKAEKPDTVRSNALTVCATDGSDGACGTSASTSPARDAEPDRTAPRAVVLGIREQQVFRRGRGPRVLRGRAGERFDRSPALRPDPSSLLGVDLKLTRTDRGRCSTWSGTRERLVRRPCGASRGWWFRIGDRAEWEYQLARRLPRGRYVLDTRATDRAGNRDDERRRADNRVVFHVR